MQITVLAIANFHASCGPIEAGETVAVIETDQELSVTRDLLSLLRSGRDFEMDSKVEVGELLSLVRTADKVYCESDDPEFEKDREPVNVEDLIEDQEPPKPAPKRRRKKAAANAAE